MNRSHAGVTDWGLSHMAVAQDAIILDVGCGGGRTIGRLAAMAPAGRIHGVDYSEESVAVSRKLSARDVAAGRIDIRLASVSSLPYADATFDLVTAVETHIWWPDLPNDLREVWRVLKPGGCLTVISEVYRDAPTVLSRLAAKAAERTGMTLLSVEEHHDLLRAAGYVHIDIDTDPRKGWICAMGRRPTST